jgi:CRP-like cAMP-binding protein
MGGQMHGVRLRDDDNAAVRMAPLFAGLSERGLAELLDDAALLQFARDEILFAQGDAAAGFFVVLEGWVKLYRITTSGEQAVVGVFTRGESFGEAVCFSGADYPVTGQAVTESRLLMVSARGMAERIRRNPEIGLAMLASTSQHLHLLVRQIEELKAQTGAQRLAEFLLELTPIRRGPCTIVLPYEKALIAGRLGMKPESLSRAFQRLRHVGVRTEQSTAQVSDVAALAAFASEERATVFKCAGFSKDCVTRARARREAGVTG